MVRTQILLEESQYRMLKDEAQATGRSLSEIVRSSIDAHLAKRQQDPLFDIVGCVQSKDDQAPEDLAEHHDAYLYGGKP